MITSIGCLSDSAVHGDQKVSWASSAKTGRQYSSLRMKPTRVYANRMQAKKIIKYYDFKFRAILW